MPSEYRLRRRVQFYETDAAGIVHFSCFYRYMEEAEHALWRAAGLSINPTGGVVGFPRVSASFDFHKPLRFEDEFDIHIRIAEFGERSIQYETTIKKDGGKIATGHLTIACVKKSNDATLTSTIIPADIVSRLKTFRQDMTE